MFRHVVMLQWTPDATTEQQAAVRDGLATLPGLIPEIRSYTIGADAQLNEGNYDLVIVADFDTVDDYFVYRDNPDHQAVIQGRIRPILAGRAAVQHQL
jgi:Stress responsive A/B Barrel Domain